MKHAEARALKKAFDHFAIAGWAVGNVLAITTCPDLRDWVVAMDSIAAVVLFVNAVTYLDDWRRA